MLTKGQVGEIYNIGAHHELTNRELTHRLIELCGRDEGFIEPVADRPAENGDTVVASLVGLVTNPKEKREPLLLDALA